MNKNEVYCSSCDSEINESNNYCSNCGEELTDKNLVYKETEEYETDHSTDQIHIISIPAVFGYFIFLALGFIDPVFAIISIAFFVASIPLIGLDISTLEDKLLGIPAFLWVILIIALYFVFAPLYVIARISRLS